MKEWNDFFKEEEKKEYYSNLIYKVKEDRKNKVIFPEELNTFKAFELTKLSDIKVVILGQDPYHNDGEAMGISFSVPADRKKIPPSLKNIFKEIYREDYETLKTNINGDLTYLAQQGVLLLNSTLTVEKNKPNSHADYGWQTFTDNCIKYINDNKKDVVFLLWGSFAHKKEILINNNPIIKTSHPSPFSAHKGFLNSDCFNETNLILKNKGLVPIHWKAVL